MAQGIWSITSESAGLSSVDIHVKGSILRWVLFIYQTNPRWNLSRELLAIDKLNKFPTRFE